MKFIFCTLTLFILGISIETSGQKTSLSTPQEMNDKGSEFYKNKNYTEAIKWFKLSAEQNNAIAQHNLGIMYRDGLGVSKDFEEALKWFKLAATQGKASSQFCLGHMYYSGQGVKDDVEAIKWFKLAAAQGSTDSQFNLGVIFLTGDYSIVDYDEAIRWFRLAADRGNEEAKNYVRYIERINAFSERVNLDSFLSTTCDCIQANLNTAKNKLEFSTGTQNCYAELYQKLLKTNKNDFDFSEYKGLIIFGLAKKCTIWKNYHDKEQRYLNEKEESKIKDQTNCRIVRQGIFTPLENYDDIEIKMMDSIQMITFKKTGYYSKLKVQWIDDCSYKLIFIESTSPMEKSVYKNEGNRIIRIIDIVNEDTIIYQLESDGAYNIGSMTKQREPVKKD